MTFLPEVEVIRKDLEKDVVGKRFKDVTVRSAALVAHHRNRPEFYKALQGRKIESVARRGTWLLLTLDDQSVLVAKLGPQGSLTRETATEEPGKHNQLVAVFTTGGAMHYSDPSKGAEFLVVSPEEKQAVLDSAPTGFDPLADQFTWPALSRRLQDRQTKLKPLLIDDSFIVGLGDLYSDEVLWGAGLSGERPSESLSSQEVRRLYRAILEVLHEAVKQRGPEPEPDEVDPFGDTPEFGEHVRVYGRDGKPCGRCRQLVTFGTIDGRYPSYFCPNCQT